MVLPIIMRRTLLVTAVALAFCTGCGSFDRAWDEALASEMTTDGLSGAWEGRWESRVNGHTGELRCLVSPVLPTTESKPSEATHQFWYHAGWGILAGGFETEYEAIPDGPGVWRVSGAKDLGQILGGTFSHQARFSKDTMNATYDSRLDRGIMRMQKVHP